MGRSAAVQNRETVLTSSRRDADAESWSFALRIHAEPGVADACLRLQNEAGVDVMILLTTAFAAVRLRVVLQADDLREIDQACRAWREQIVRPLRVLRTTLKSGPPPAPGRATEQLRSAIKRSERVAERLQNRLIAKCLRGKPASPERATPAMIGAALQTVVALAVEARGGGDIDSLGPVIGVVAGAAIRMME